MRSARAASVSVVIPVYNCERYLAAAIESVLAQTAPPGEILVVDDGSTDGSAALARAFGAPVTCLAQPHAGLSASLNCGIERSRGAYLAFLDADDLWVEDKLAGQLDALEADPALDGIFGHVEQFASPDIDPAKRPRIPEAARVAPGYLTSTLLIRADALRRVGAFDPRWQIGNFVDWYLRAQEAGLRDAMLSRVVLRRRLHTDNLGIRERNLRRDYARIIKHALDRRRQLDAGAAARDASTGANVRDGSAT
jgi:glycosyltransferase involved in cell wall biosynthesis